MKNVHLVNNVVFEVLPEEAAPVEKWYNEVFAKECMEAPDEVDQHWVYDPVKKQFFEPGYEIPQGTGASIEPLLDAIIQ